MDRVDIVIVGAGVVGLAIAAELSQKGMEIVVVERHDAFGQDTSSRNSEVIHSGIYYPEGSLKASLCVEGARLLYEFCVTHGIPHKRLGKFIVATEESEVADLEALFARGHRNGAAGLVMIDRNEVQAAEPNVNAVAAIHAPNTGIIDSHSLMKRLYTIAESAGVIFGFQSELASITRIADGFRLSFAGQDYGLETGVLVNSAGLFSDHVASLAGIDIDAKSYRLSYTKGSYFSYAGRSPVSRLIYPVPHTDLKGLGVHATLDLGGRLRFGPDTESVETIDYRVDPSRKNSFYEGARRIIRGIDPESLVPDMSGIRPKIKGEGIRDFVIKHEAPEGLPGFINLIGIESPGLTACLSIARRVSLLADEALG